MVKKNATEDNSLQEPIKVDTTLNRKLEFEKTIAAISSRFVCVSDINGAINISLAEIGRLNGACRAYLFLFKEDEKTMDNTHEWCAEGVSPQIDNLQNLPTSMVPWWMKKLNNGEVIHVEDVSKLPLEAKAEKEILEAQDIKSLLVLPLYTGSRLAGFIGFDNVFESGRWSEDDLALLRISAEIIGNALVRRKAEEELKSSRDQLDNIINSATELIFSINKGGIITAWNNAIALKTGFSQREILSKNIYSNEIPEEISSLIDLIKSTLKAKKSEILEHEIKDKDGNPILLLSDTSIIKGKDNNIEGIVLIGRDISSQRRLHQQIMPGNSYISYNESFEAIIEVFNKFADKKYSLLCVSRGNLNWLKSRLSNKAAILEISQKDSLLKEIKALLNKNNRSIILLNRLEYISLMDSFRDLLIFLYTLNDLISSTNNIVIIHIIESSFEKRELSILKQEFNLFPTPKKEDIHLDKKKIDILRFISDKNSLHAIVNFNLISTEFALSRMTTRSWLRELQLKSLIQTNRQGNVKQVYITNKGRELISNY
ncbi:MAG: DUF835 domain-containing protein [Nanoarchaeota archaeon]|nr:DUF835 domain-containing protein [Nanoarchaeota archaeon]